MFVIVLLLVSHIAHDFSAVRFSLSLSHDVWFMNILVNFVDSDFHYWWRNIQKTVSYRSVKVRKRINFFHANAYFLGWNWVTKSPSLSKYFFARSKSLFSFSAIFLSEKASRKKLMLLLLFRFFTSFPVTENITMSGKKFSACAIQSQKRICRFFFFFQNEKKSWAKEEPEHCAQVATPRKRKRGFLGIRIFFRCMYPTGLEYKNK